MPGLRLDSAAFRDGSGGPTPEFLLLGLCGRWRRGKNTTAAHPCILAAAREE